MGFLTYERRASYRLNRYSLPNLAITKCSGAADSSMTAPVVGGGESMDDLLDETHSSSDNVVPLIGTQGDCEMAHGLFNIYWCVAGTYR